MTEQETQELKAYKEFYNKVQEAMDTSYDVNDLVMQIDLATEDCCDALSIRH